MSIKYPGWGCTVLYVTDSIFQNNFATDVDATGCLTISEGDVLHLHGTQFLPSGSHSDGALTTVLVNQTQITSCPDHTVSGSDIYMTADYTVSCHSSEYHFGFIWACVMIFVYPIGCPASSFHLLHGIRHEILARDEDVTVESGDENAEISEEMRLTQEKLLSLNFFVVGNCWDHTEITVDRDLSSDRSRISDSNCCGSFIHIIFPSFVCEIRTIY